MAKLKPNEKRVQLSFQRPDDLALFSFLSERAYERRYDLPTFILLSLHEAFEGQVAVPDDTPFNIPDSMKNPEIDRIDIYHNNGTGEKPTFLESINLMPPAIEPSPAPVSTASEEEQYEKIQEEIRQTQTKFRGKLKSGRHAIPVPGIGLEPPTDASK